jgi:Ssp1 endopeptidase immunity protein Rap1a
MSRFLATALSCLLFASLTETKASAPSRTTAEELTTGNFLIEACQMAIDSSAQNIYDSWRAGICDGLVAGVMYASPTVCHDPDVTLGQSLRVVEKYLQEHPEKLHLNGSKLTDEALSQAFPCKN